MSAAQAIPDDLDRYGSAALGMNDQLLGFVRRDLGPALEELRSRCPDLGWFDQVQYDIAAYAIQNNQPDSKVIAVAQAFRDADSCGVGSSGIVSTRDELLSLVRDVRHVTDAIGDVGDVAKAFAILADPSAYIAHAVTEATKLEEFAPAFSSDADAEAALLADVQQVEKSFTAASEAEQAMTATEQSASSFAELAGVLDKVLTPIAVVADVWTIFGHGPLYDKALATTNLVGVTLTASGPLLVALGADAGLVALIPVVGQVMIIGGTVIALGVLAYENRKLIVHCVNAAEGFVARDFIAPQVEIVGQESAALISGAGEVFAASGRDLSSIGQSVAADGHAASVGITSLTAGWGHAMGGPVGNLVSSVGGEFGEVTGAATKMAGAAASSVGGAVDTAGGALEDAGSDIAKASHVAGHWVSGLFS